MTYNPAGGATYNLGSSIGSTDTTILLSSFLEPVSNVPYTMVLLNTDIAYATISPGTSSSEFISFTGITQNANGTATLTGVSRGLAKKYPFTTSSTFKLPHSGQSLFILSDAPQVFKKYGTLENNELITGFWEAPDPISNQGLVTNLYMLNLINGGPINVGSVLEAGIAGETLVAGNLIYFSETDNEWLKTDADTLSTIFNVKIGIAMGAGVNGGSITNGVLTYGTYTTSGLTPGDICYASNTAGGINSGTAGTVPRVIGIAKDSTTLYFDPNFQNFLYNYAADSVGTDSYAITMPAALSVPFLGMELNFKVATANTGAATLAINGGSAISIVKNVNSALETGDVLANQILKVIYTGSAWLLMSPLGTSPGKAADVQVFTSTGTWTKPANAKSVSVIVIGGGASGASGAARAFTTNNNVLAGGGGGGGAISIGNYNASNLSSTVSVTVGAQVAGGVAVNQAGTANSVGNDGIDGNPSSFGTLLVANGGKKGVQAADGGAGGFSVGFGSSVASTSATAILGQGGATPSSADGKSSESGGGSGGSKSSSETAAGFKGGSSVFGCGGGGGGATATTNSGSASGAGGDGGQVLSYTVGGGGAGGTSQGGTGTAGTRNGNCSSGGGGGSGISVATTGSTAGSGGAGGAPGGGGGGGGAIGGLTGTTLTSGAGGVGARGEVIVITYF